MFLLRSTQSTINTLCGQNVELVNVKPGCAYSNHWALQGYSSIDGADAVFI
jgi:hypothetical protein